MRFRTVFVFLISAFLWMNVAIAQDRLELADGSSIQYFLTLPDITGEAPLPLAVFMGGGSGNAPISYTVYRFYASELANLGWAVIVPISPDNRSFRGVNVDRVRELIRHLQQRDDVREGKTLLAGISAGGMSALEIARRHPDEVLGIMAVPALVRDDTNLDALAGMPVYLRIGSADELGWGMQYDATVRALEAANVVLDADLLYGEPHMFGLDWGRVESWLETLE
jgi:pimeloyl-ACP methyl ester carboxylesterase